MQALTSGHSAAPLFKCCQAEPHGLALLLTSKRSLAISLAEYILPFRTGSLPNAYAFYSLALTLSLFKG